MTMSIEQKLYASCDRWLVTGAAGFIGSHLVDFLLKHGQVVVGLDHGSMQSLGVQYLKNLEDNHKKFRFVHGDCCDESLCDTLVKETDYILHQAALSSAMLVDGYQAIKKNIQGFRTIAAAAESMKIRHVVYASSSAVYGDGSHHTQSETNQCKPLSLYALTKYQNERDAQKIMQHIPSTGLRYFNVYGSGQTSDYGAVIPTWIECIAENNPCHIFGKETICRDFVFIDDVVRSNVMAALAPSKEHCIYNVGTGKGTTLRQLFDVLSENMSLLTNMGALPLHNDMPRNGDIFCSVAEMTYTQDMLGFVANIQLDEGLRRIVRSIAMAQNAKTRKFQWSGPDDTTLLKHSEPPHLLQQTS